MKYNILDILLGAMWGAIALTMINLLVYFGLSLWGIV